MSATRCPDRIRATGNTFVVRILRNEHGTWQGTVGHVQSGAMVSFRSCLELIQYINRELERQGRSDAETPLKKVGNI